MKVYQSSREMLYKQAMLAASAIEKRSAWQKEAACFKGSDLRARAYSKQTNTKKEIVLADTN